MDWKFDNINREWILSDGTDEFCKICIKNNDKAKVNKFKTKSLIHKMLCGKQKNIKMDKKNNTWYCIKERKFSDKTEMEKYITVKKKELLSYLKNF
jgi:hypothetical protein